MNMLTPEQLNDKFTIQNNIDEIGGTLISSIEKLIILQKEVEKKFVLSTSSFDWWIKDALLLIEPLLLKSEAIEEIQKWKI